MLHNSNIIVITQKINQSARKLVIGFVSQLVARLLINQSVRWLGC
jgi:hypothetical protein